MSWVNDGSATLSPARPGAAPPHSQLGGGSVPSGRPPQSLGSGDFYSQQPALRAAPASLLGIKGQPERRTVTHRGGVCIYSAPRASQGHRGLGTSHPWCPASGR